MRGEQGRRDERLVVTTLKAVRNDGKQPDIKGRDTSKLLESSPRISKISRPQPFIVGQAAQHICYRNPTVPAPKAKTTCRREREPHGEPGDPGRVCLPAPAGILLGSLSKYHAGAPLLEIRVKNTPILSPGFCICKRPLPL